MIDKILGRSGTRKSWPELEFQDHFKFDSMAISRKAVVVGLSGCSSSGKTTLARLLRDIFPNTFVLHEDDFYKPETE